MTVTLSQADARRLTLAAQGFASRRAKNAAAVARRPGWPQLRSTINRIGLLQIDSVNALTRSHYLPLFSRLGVYDTASLDRQAFATRPQQQRQLFEYWAHEASLLPVALQPLLRWRMARARQLQSGAVYRQISELVRSRRRYVNDVLRELRDRGPLSARELSQRGSKAGWWTWHDGKTALEYWFWAGEVSCTGRRGNFERVYDLSEQVLPDKILAAPTPTEADAQRELIMLAARAYGVADEPDLRDYFRLKPADSRRALNELVEAGRLLPATVQGWDKPAYLDPDATAPKPVPTAALLSPFDPLVWRRERAERLFGFRYRLEIYTPAERRRYGYYVLPFLHDERLCARVDLKSDRPNRTLRVLAAHAEADLKPARAAKRATAALAVQLVQLAVLLGLEHIAVDAGGGGDLSAPLAKLAPSVQQAH